MDPFYFTIVGLSFAFVGFILILPLFTCLRRAKAEHNLKPLWQKRCTGNIGYFATNIPSIRAAIYQDFPRIIHGARDLNGIFITE
jgi:hypothetical protein